MDSMNYPRVFRAALCSVLLLSQHAVVNANTWATGRPPSRSSTLAVAAPGGRDRPIRDWKQIKEDANKADEENRQARQARRTGAVAEAPEEVVDATEEAVAEVETAVHQSLELEEGTPQFTSLTVGKIAAIAAVGVYGARKVLAFAKAMLKARKEAAEEGGEGGSAVATTNDDEKEEEEEEAGDGEKAEAAAAGEDDEGEAEDKVTGGSATAEAQESDEEEAVDAPDVAGAAKDVHDRAAVDGLNALREGLTEGLTMDDATVTEEGDSSAGTSNPSEEKVDTSYV